MNTRRTLNLKALIAVAIAMPMSATLYAAPGTTVSEAPSPAFQKLDVDRDGYISRDEAALVRDFSKALDEADDNRDGRLDPDEFVKAQAVHERMRAKAYIDDSMITARVKAALVKDPDVKALAVGVKTEKGVVLLSGFVDSERQAHRAQEIAVKIEGVKRVMSKLLVKS